MQKFWTNTIVSVRSHLDKIKLRFSQTTLREKILLAILVLGAALYAPVYALDQSSEQTEAFVEALSERSSARITAQTARRIQTNASDAAILEDMKTWGFQADNIAIAKVLIEQKIMLSAETIGAEDVRVTTLFKLDSHGPTHWVQAEVSLPLRWTPAFKLIDAIGEWPEGFRVTAFNYEVTQPGGRVNRDGSITQDQGTIRYNLAFPVRLKHMPEDEGRVGNSQQGASS